MCRDARAAGARALGQRHVRVWVGPCETTKGCRVGQNYSPMNLASTEVTLVTVNFLLLSVTLRGLTVANFYCP